MRRHILEITSATIMGTMCWPFNFIYVRRDGGNVSCLKQASPSDYYYYLAAKEKKNMPS